MLIHVAVQTLSPSIVDFEKAVCCYKVLHLLTIVSPVEQCLPLFWSATEIALFTVLLDLSTMSLHCFPSFDLTLIIRASPPHVVPAIPLKPPPRIFMINPPSFLPNRQRLRSIDFKIIQHGIMPFMTKLCVDIPVFRKLTSTVGHVFATENSHLQQLLWRYFRREFWVKIHSDWFSKIIHIIFLHEIAYNYLSFLHYIFTEVKKYPNYLFIYIQSRACPHQAWFVRLDAICDHMVMRYCLLRSSDSLSHLLRTAAAS